MKPTTLLPWFIVGACWLSPISLLGQVDGDDEKKSAVPVLHALLSEEFLERLVFSPPFAVKDGYVVRQGGSWDLRKQLDSILALRLEDIDKTCKLTSAQKSKLELAGRGDIRRFYDRYEQIRRQFPPEQAEQFAQIWPEISREAHGLTTTVRAGPLVEDSLLVKSLRNTLTPEQFARYDAVCREGNPWSHGVNIAVAVRALGPLRDDQRQALIDLLSKSTKPPRKSGWHDVNVLQYRLARLPEDRVRPLLDKSQWTVVSRRLAQFKALEPQLKQMGALPDDEDEKP